MGFLDIFKGNYYKKLLEQSQKEQEQLKAKQMNYEALGLTTVEKVQSEINKLNHEKKQLNKQMQEEIKHLSNEKEQKTLNISTLNNTITELKEQEVKYNKQINTQTNKISRMKEIYKSIDYSVKNYSNFEDIENIDLEEIELYSPSIVANLHSYNTKELRKAFKENEKQIDKLLEVYKSRYTTKANKSIYQLMVIALKAELQNALTDLKYNKLDTSIDKVKHICQKYLKIAGEGNQSIVNTLTRFISQIEYLFINAVKIEYTYYTKKEQARQEQLAIRQQMREEAEERKALQQEKERIINEENKFQNEIEKAKELLSSTKDLTKVSELERKIAELESQLSNVIVKKENIINLQNGKAGNVYIISNKGSFGDDVFKIGMTRRLEPQDRVNELGSASVPFKYDVHSFIFSDDAVSLESKLHERLDDKRINKVNRRKEFFKVDIKELKELVDEIDPTAEFNELISNEEYFQSFEM